MGLRINQNVEALNAYRNLSVTSGQMAKSLEKLSSGYRINRAADDAAGLSISEGLRAQIGGTKVAVRNAQDGISVVQTAEGALSEVHGILQRMRDLAVQASNTGSQDTDAIAAAQTEIDELGKELDRIGNTTSFGSTKLLNGEYGVKAATTTSAEKAGVNASTANTNAGYDLKLSGIFKDSTGTTVDLSSGVTFNVKGDYSANTAAAAATMQTDLQSAVDGALAAQGLALGTVTVSVTKGTTGLVTEFSSTKMSATGGQMTVADAGTNTGGTAALFTSLTKVGLSGSGGSFQVGANTSADDKISVSISQINATLLVGTIDLANNSTNAITAIDGAISSVSTTRATLGALQNRFEHTINNLNVAVENLSASESRIRDTDMAQEMVSFTRSQILSQAGTAMLAQANQAPQNVLQLLR